MLRITNYPITFELFFGGGRGEVAPEFEKIDQLRIGDVIDVYFDAKGLDGDERYNRLAYFIDKDKIPYFIRGAAADRAAMHFLWILVGSILVLLIVLKKKGKIA